MTIRFDDARLCAMVARRHARTFTLASRFLPPAKRRAAFAVYAFCRTADDIVDMASPGDDSAAALDRYRRRLDAALHGDADDAVFRELSRAITDFDIPGATLHDLLRGIERDLEPARYASWHALASYCEGVASTVGEMCAHVFGVEGGSSSAPAAVRYARTLGVAMQLTNILRDVGEDAARGRCYLPEDELAAFGLSREVVVTRTAALPADERWRPLMAFQIGRARALYEAALPGIALLARDARRCASACALGYAAILDAIEARGYDTITQRARVGSTARVALLWRVWRGGTRPAQGFGGPYVAPWHGTAAREVTTWS
jgi:15-cis-phytoene synthase